MQQNMIAPNVSRAASRRASIPDESYHRPSSATLHPRPTPPSTPPTFPKPRVGRLERLKLSEDYRGRLSPFISRFLGYRPPGSIPPFAPLPFPPFTWLHHLPLRHEVWIFAWIGAFIGILLIEAIMGASTAFRDSYGSPLIVTSFGASAVLLFGVVESPLAQPRNFVLGQFVSALVGTAISRLFVFNASYRAYLDNATFHGTTFVNGGLSMATALLAQLVLGITHPPAGATALNAAVELDVVALSWRYLPTVLASSLIMLGWALVINNLGRRRYPVYWWSPESTFISSTMARADENEEEEELKTLEEGRLRKAEDGGRTAEGLLEERIEGEGGDTRNLEEATGPEARSEEETAVEEPAGEEMDMGDKWRAEGLE